jgi:hypothetical protein
VCKTGCSPPSSIEFKNGGVILTLPHATSWHGTWFFKQRHDFTFTLLHVQTVSSQACVHFKKEREVIRFLEVCSIFRWLSLYTSILHWQKACSLLFLGGWNPAGRGKAMHNSYRVFIQIFSVPSGNYIRMSNILNRTISFLPINFRYLFYFISSSAMRNLQMIRYCKICGKGATKKLQMFTTSVISWAISELVIERGSPNYNPSAGYD